MKVKLISLFMLLTVSAQAKEITEVLCQNSANLLNKKIQERAKELESSVESISTPASSYLTVCATVTFKTASGY